jgi:hypothetical protein
MGFGCPPACQGVCADLALVRIVGGARQPWRRAARPPSDADRHLRGAPVEPAELPSRDGAHRQMAGAADQRSTRRRRWSSTDGVGGVHRQLCQRAFIPETEGSPVSLGGFGCARCPAAKAHHDFDPPSRLRGSVELEEQQSGGSDTTSKARRRCSADPLLGVV